jgi:hypothetical protein
MSARMLTLPEAMAALYPRTHGLECADKYRAIAEWWRLHSRESASPAEPLAWAANMDERARFLERAP